MSSSNRRTAATVHTTLCLPLPQKLPKKELHGKPSSTRKSRTSNKHAKTQKKKKKKKKHGVKLKQNSTLETHRKEGQTSSRKTKFRPPKTSTQEERQTKKTCNDKKKYKKH
jgi:hypothetical protein